MQESLSLQSEQTSLRYEIRKLTDVKNRLENELAKHRDKGRCILNHTSLSQVPSLKPDYRASTSSESGHFEATDPPVITVPFSSYTSPGKSRGSSETVTLGSRGSSETVTLGSCSDRQMQEQAAVRVCDNSMQTASPRGPACANDVAVGATGANGNSVGAVGVIAPADVALTSIKQKLSQHSFVSLEKFRELASQLTGSVKPPQHLTSTTPLFCDVMTTQHQNIADNQRVMSSENARVLPPADNAAEISVSLSTAWNMCDSMTSSQADINPTKVMGCQQTTNPVEVQRFILCTDGSLQATANNARVNPCVSSCVSPIEDSSGSCKPRPPSTWLQNCEPLPLGTERAPFTMVNTGVCSGGGRSGQGGDDKVEYSSTRLIAVSALLELNRTDA